MKFIYSGNNEFPFDAREQWTDSCNLLALREESYWVMTAMIKPLKHSKKRV